MTDAGFKPPPGWQTSSGEMAALFDRTDWAATALGAREAWSASLKLAASIMLGSAQPMALRWGPEFVLLYNDAYRPILGDKHPRALGVPARDAWSEVWSQIGPAHGAILSARVPAIFAEKILLRIQRHGAAWEDAYFTLGYSAVDDPTAASGVGGVLVTAVEITNRVATENALRASEERYELALAAAGGIGTWDWDIVNDRVIANSKFAELYCVDPAKALVGEPVATFVAGIHPDDRDRVSAEINHCIETHGLFASEYRLVQRDGSIVWVFARGRVQYDAQGNAVRLPGATVDITERKAAEADVARSEAQFRTFAQAMPDHVWAADPLGQLDWVNERVQEYSGFAAASLHGAGWIAMVHPDDRAAAAARWASALASGQTYQVEFRLRRTDGAYRWHIARALPIRGTNGAIERWIGTNTDIEDERQALDSLEALNATLEQRVARQSAERDRLWQTSQDLLAVIDAQGTMLAVNPAWTSVLGWLPGEVVGRNHLFFSHPEDRPRSDGALAHASLAPLPGVEVRNLHKDGSYRWIAWIASPENGLVYATGRHVTAEKQAAAALADAQEALRQSQKMEAVGQLTGGIAHDFNNMLAVVMGSLELLGRRLAGGDARAQRYLDAAADSARRASLLTQRLLAFSRQQPLQPEAVDANKLMAGMSDLLRHSLGTDVRLETVLAGGLWRTFADPNQLENIVLNLAVNARDAMPAGGRLTIETQNAHLDDRYVSVHPGVAAGQYVLIAVTDSGTGMPREVIDKAFDPFFTTKPVGKGTGLGLSQVYGFVKQSGGHVKIYSEVGQGTTIKIYLPRLAGAAAGDDAHDGEAGQLMPLGEYREVILVVEDEPAVRNFSVEALRELGYRVFEADGAASALRILDLHSEIVLLFTDVVMPDTNGAKLAQEARRRRPGLRVLFTTGYTRNAVVHNGVLDPGVEMIGKPFTLDALASKVRLVLEAP
jgi:PAS domain S-box-containing protein